MNLLFLNIVKIKKDNKHEKQSLSSAWEAVIAAAHILHQDLIQYPLCNLLIQGFKFNSGNEQKIHQMTIMKQLKKMSRAQLQVPKNKKKENWQGTNKDYLQKKS